MTRRPRFRSGQNRAGTTSGERFAAWALAVARGLALLTAIAAPFSTGGKSVFAIGMLLAVLASGRAVPVLLAAVRQPFGAMIVALGLWLVLGVLWAPTDWPQRWETLEAWSPLPLAVVVLGLFDRVAYQRRFALFYTLALIIWAGVSTYLWLIHDNPRGEGEGIVMITHTAQSVAFIGAVFGCARLIVERDTRRLLKLLAWAGGILLVFNVAYVSPSRSGVIALAAAAAVIAWLKLQAGRRLLVLAAAGLVIVVLAATSTRMQDRFEMATKEFRTFRESEQETSIGIRMVLYSNTWDLIRRSPVRGHGTSSFTTVYAPFAAGRSTGWQGQPMTDVHSQYLYVWMENGILGLLLLLGLIATGIRQGLRNGATGMIAAGFLVTIAVTSLFNSHFRSLAEGYQWAFIVGALAAVGRHRDAVAGAPPGPVDAG